MATITLNVMTVIIKETMMRRRKMKMKETMMRRRRKMVTMIRAVMKMNRAKRMTVRRG
jgi:hypothetical protein